MTRFIHRVALSNVTEFQLSPVLIGSETNPEVVKAAGHSESHISVGPDALIEGAKKEERRQEVSGQEQCSQHTE